MKNLLFTLFVALSYFTFLPANAVEYAKKQELFNVELNLKPNTTIQPSQNQIDKISGDIPVFILTDKNNNISGIQVGQDNDGTTLLVESTQKTGPETSQKKTIKPSLYSTVAGHDWTAQKQIHVTASSPIRDKQELFMIDATRLNAEKGGKVILHYPSSLIFGTTNKVELILRKAGADRWVATILQEQGPSFSSFSDSSPALETEKTKEKIIKSAKIETSFTGVGLNEPKFKFLDPNEVAEKLKVQPISDPRVIESVAAQTKGAFNAMESKSLTVPSFGLKLEVVQQSRVAN